MRALPWLPLISSVLAAWLAASSAHAQSVDGCGDPTLSELAATHALEDLGPAELLARARAAGASHPSLHLVALADDDLEGRARWLRGLAARGLGPLVCGEALVETSRIVLAAPACAQAAQRDPVDAPLLVRTPYTDALPVVELAAVDEWLRSVPVEGAGGASPMVQRCA